MLFVQNFTIKNRSRLSEFLEFKGNHLTATEFKHEPKLSNKDGSFQISLRSNMEDIISLERLFESWKAEDSKPELQIEDQGIIKKMFYKLIA